MIVVGTRYQGRDLPFYTPPSMLDEINKHKVMSVRMKGFNHLFHSHHSNKKAFDAPVSRVL